MQSIIMIVDPEWPDPPRASGLQDIVMYNQHMIY